MSFKCPRCGREFDSFYLMYKHLQGCDGKEDKYVTTVNKLMNKYKEGLARCIGVNTDKIRDDIAERWCKNWSKAILKEEAWKRIWE